MSVFHRRHDVEEGHENPVPALRFQPALLSADRETLVVDGLLQVPGAVNRSPFTIVALLDGFTRVGLVRGPLPRWTVSGTSVELQLLVTAAAGVMVQLRSPDERVDLRVLALSPAPGIGLN